MDEVAFHCEPPPHLPTMVVAFGGWVDAGEAATGALRALVRQLAAPPLATIDLEEFVDFTQLRPVVRLDAEGQRRIRWPRSAFWTWQPPTGSLTITHNFRTLWEQPKGQVGDNKKGVADNTL